MKQTFVIALLLISSGTFAQPADQQRRPAYQGYGSPAPTPTPEFSEEVEAPTSTPVELKLEAALENGATDAAMSASSNAASDATVSTEATADAQADIATDTEAELADEEPQAEGVVPVIESSPLHSEPGATSRVLVAPPATLLLNGDKTLSSVISPAETSTELSTFDTTQVPELQPVPAEPVKLSPARWQVDIVVFRAGGPQALRAERWDRNPGRPDVEQFDVISDSNANSLLEVIGRLDESPAHQPLLQRSLVFDQLPDFLRTRGTAFETTQAIIDADLVRGHSTMPTPASRFDWPEVLGTVKLKQGAELSVSVDLLFTYPTALPYRSDETDDPFLAGGFELPADENLYQLGHIRLQQTAAASAGKLLYFDNPAIGAIVNITELTPQPIEQPPVTFADTAPEARESDEVTSSDFEDEAPGDDAEFTGTQTIDVSEDEATRELSGDGESDSYLEIESEVEGDIVLPSASGSDPAADTTQPESSDPVEPVAP